MTKLTTILISISLLLTISGCVSINNNGSNTKETNMEELGNCQTKRDFNEVNHVCYSEIMKLYKKSL